MRGKYIRTPEIRNKQSLVMVERTKTYNFEEIRMKRESTVRLHGIKVGRKIGSSGKKLGCYQPCRECWSPMWVVPSSPRTFCSRKCQFTNPEFLFMLKTIDRSYMKTVDYIASKSKPETTEYRRYKNKVHKLSESTYKKYITQINPHSYKRTLCGVEGGYQLDHIIPVRICFESGVTPESASGVNNLRLLPWKENLMRNYGNSIS